MYEYESCSVKKMRCRAAPQCTHVFRQRGVKRRGTEDGGGDGVAVEGIIRTRYQVVVHTRTGRNIISVLSSR